MRYRKKARENGFLVLYRWDIRGDSLDKVLQEVIEEKHISNEEIINYMKKLVYTVKDNLVDIDSIISEHLKDWSFDRLGYMERSMLRLGTGELLFIGVPDPGRAFIDYVDIMKRYGDEKSAKFVNGVLSAIYKERRNGKN